MPNLFTPPGRVERRGDTHRLFGRQTITRGVSLLKAAGLYRQIESPSDEDIAASDIAYLGGHVYVVSDTEAAALAEAGYGASVVKPGAGYGAGGYGEGVYGADGTNSTTSFGAGSFGSGSYGG